MKLNDIPFANTSITIYNRFDEMVEGKRRTSYKGTVIKDSLYKRSGLHKINGMTLISDDEFIAIAPNDTAFLPYQDWKICKDNHFTCNVGDVVVLGEFLHIIPSGIDCISHLKTIEPDINLKCFTAKETRVNDGVSGLAHFFWKGK